MGRRKDRDSKSEDSVSEGEAEDRETDVDLHNEVTTVGSVALSGMRAPTLLPEEHEDSVDRESPVDALDYALKSVAGAKDELLTERLPDNEFITRDQLAQAQDTIKEPPGKFIRPNSDDEDTINDHRNKKHAVQLAPGDFVVVSPTTKDETQDLSKKARESTPLDEEG
jgi:hypothetical protein